MIAAYRAMRWVGVPVGVADHIAVGMFHVRSFARRVELDLRYLVWRLK